MAFLVTITSESKLIERTENIDRFYKDVRKIPLLTDEREAELFDIYRNGTPSEREKAKNEIVLANERFVISMAKNYSTVDNLLDHVNELNIALLEAVDKYKPEFGTKFITYAVWFMRRKMNEYRTQTEPLIKKTNETKTFHVISKAINDFTQIHERIPSNDELLELVNTKYGKQIKDKNDLLQIQYTCADPIEDESDDTLVGEVKEFNAYSASHNGYLDVEDQENKRHLIDQMLAVLPEREQQLMKMRFGIADQSYGDFKKEYTLSEIAEKLGLTTERVRQLEREVINKLKKNFKHVLTEL